MNDSSLHQELYEDYLEAKEDSDAYTHTYTSDEIADLLQKASEVE